MRRFFLIAAVVGVLGSLAIAQNLTSQTSPAAKPRKSPLAPYAGTWVGTFQSRPWLTLTLSLQGEQMTGSVQRARSIEFNDQGDLKAVSTEGSKEAIQSATIQGGGLLITAKDPDSQETSRYMMHLTTEAAAQVRAVGASMPPGMPKPLPWKITRQAAGVSQTTQPADR